MNIQGRDEAIQFLQQQEEQASAVQSETTNIQHAFESAKLQELYSKSVSNIANAVERHGRAESNIGLFEERLSMIQKNRSISTREKMDALIKLVEATKSLGEVEAMVNLGTVESITQSQGIEEDQEKADAKRTALSNQFTQDIMGKMMGQIAQNEVQPQEMQQPEMTPEGMQ
jgi:CRISPR/Cas system-associated protein Cas5 (RAMP superfamily)